MNSFEQLSSQIPPTENPEKQADRELDELLEDPDNDFLMSIPMNRKMIEDAETAVEALAIAKERINARAERSLKFRVGSGVENVEQLSINIDGLKRTFKELSERGQSIGEGGDANVYIAATEIYDGVSEICYKFSKAVGTNRGRNSMERELELQGDFLKTLQTYGPELSVGVPKPFYYCEMGSQKMLAMERLMARSLTDLQRGKGTIPDWVTEAHIDTFCDDLLRALNVLHAAGFYHRDLHFGNIMFTQSPQPAEKLGYIIDFGVSGNGQEGMDPYKNEVRGEVFTYADDCGRIEAGRGELKRLLWSTAR